MEADIASQSVGLGSSVDFSLWSLFLRADIIVKSVIVLLIAASIYTWAIIIEKFKLFKELILILQWEDLLTNFGTFESCVNKEKIECERWKDYKIKQSNVHNIKWNINSKKTIEKKNKNDSSIKININIPLKERCI